jgi:hypothetical protein
MTCTPKERNDLLSPLTSKLSKIAARNLALTMTPDIAYAINTTRRMLHIGEVVNATNEDIRSLNSQARKLATITPSATADMAAQIRYLALKGLNADEIAREMSARFERT